METLMLVNPRKRRGRRSRRGSALARGGSFVRSFVPTSFGQVTPMLAGAFQGAAGALAVNAALRFLPVPALLTTGRMIYLTRAVLALGVGMAASKVAGGRIGVRMAEGALTVVAVDALRDLLLSTTGVNLGYYSPARVVGSRVAGVSGAGKYLSLASVRGGAGKYLSGGGNRLAVGGGYGMPE